MAYHRTMAMLLLMAASLWGGILSGDNAWSTPFELQPAKGKACIRPTDWMRRNHMDFLKERREQTVREVVRKPEESLLNCQTCHESRAKFCDRCHDYVGVEPDCFQCHVYP